MGEETERHSTRSISHILGTMSFLTSSEYGGFNGSEHLSTRDFQERVTPNETQRTTLIVAGVYILIIAILWLAIVFLWLWCEPILTVVKACTVSQDD